MIPLGPHIPSPKGLMERARKELIKGHMYIVFHKGKKLIVEYLGQEDHIAIVRHIQSGEFFTTAYILAVKLCWIYTLDEATEILN